MIKCSKCEAENTAEAKFCGECGTKIERLEDTLKDVDVASEQTIGMFETLGRRNQEIDKQLEFAEGDVFAGRYTIASLLGRGGMGVVYKAVDRHGERDAALKLIRPELLAGEAAVKRLIAEGVTTQELSHPNIVRVYNVDEVDNVPYVAMEFVEGPTLAEWHRNLMSEREQVPTIVAARIVMELLAGLGAAHDAGIIHRDLKPQNIILTAEPNEDNAPLKILDFGIARAASREETKSGTALGTPGYMAPEQRTDPDLADSSADLFALSKIFYKLLMDALPDGMWQPPSASRQDVPGGVDELILAGVSVNRRGRPQSAVEYRNLLVDAMNSGKPGPRPEPKPDPVDPGGGHSQSGKSEVQNFMDGPAAKPLGLGCLGLIVLILLVATLEDCSGGSNWDDDYDDDSTYLSSSGGTFDDDPPPPPTLDYSAYNGTWTSHATGQQLAATINPDRSYEIEGPVLAEWGAITMFGEFAGTRALINADTPTGTARIDFNITDESHVLLTVSLPDGSKVTDCYHVNHPAKQGCP
ncbi:MAG: serine/threonine-protein kinase [Erythrobacter sp.]